MTKSIFCLKHLFCKNKHEIHDSSNDETGLKIMEAATQIFAKEGLEGARMQHISEAAGVNKALLHYHHKNKGQLYLTVLENITTLYWSEVNKVTLDDNLSAHEFIYKWIRSLFEIQISHPDCLSIFIQEMSHGGENIKNLDPEKRAVCDQSIANIVAKLIGFIEKGEIKNLDPLHIFLNITCMSTGTFLLRPMVESCTLNKVPKIDRKYYEDRCNSIAEMVCNGILNKKQES